MVERELDVLDGADAEAGEDEEDSLRPVREAGDEEGEPGPEHHDSEDVQGSVGDFPVGEEEDEGLEVEINPGDAHYRVIGEVLVADEESGDGIEFELPPVELGG